MKRRNWLERNLSMGLPVDAFPDILERLRGTPARLEERTTPLSVTVLTERREGRWSIQENVGHLRDLELLWNGRLSDFVDGKPSMRPADVTNQGSDHGKHHDVGLAELLSGFRERRAALVARLEELPEGTLSATLPHPRLGAPMSVVDLAFFVAEHDDHHLARISEILREASSRPAAP